MTTNTDDDNIEIIPGPDAASADSDDDQRSVTDLVEQRRAAGSFEARRRRQALDWMWDIIRSRLEQEFRTHPAVAAVLDDTVAAVAAGVDAPPVAARRLLGRLRDGRN